MTFVLEIIKNAMLITGLVMVMMLFIEYINVRSNGRSFARLQRSPFGQVVVGALLGLVPGCIGGFAVVSLFTHNLFRFGALVAMTIATIGDEAFFLLALAPGTALLVSALLFAMALVAGAAVNRWVRRFPAPFPPAHFELHEHDDHAAHGRLVATAATHLRRLSFPRAMLLFGLLLFTVALLSGALEHAHGGAHDADGHAHDASLLFGERWLNVLFAAVSLATMAVVVAVDEHFLEDHLWGHVIKKHFAKIFLWTLGALLVVHGLLAWVDVAAWVGDHRLPVLLAALAIGLIPESGPHLIFITLYATGALPLSILLTNCVVQDGHTALPLLAESPRAFVCIKGLKLAVGLAVGLSGYFFGF
jgi:hypothetical protein